MRRIACAWRSAATGAGVEQEGDAVLLRRDRVLGGGVDDLQIADAQLIAARRPRVGTHGAAYHDGALLRDVVGTRKVLGGHGALDHHALDDPVPSRTSRKCSLPLERLLYSHPLIVTLAVVRPDVFDVHLRHADDSAPDACLFFEFLANRVDLLPCLGDVARRGCGGGSRRCRRNAVEHDQGLENGRLTQRHGHFVEQHRYRRPTGELRSVLAGHRVRQVVDDVGDACAW